MIMPGFNADSSLYKTGRHYYGLGPFNQTVDTIQPQGCDRNRLRECLDDCITPGCRTRCYVAFGRCPPPPPPTNCGTHFCYPSKSDHGWVVNSCCGSGCCSPDLPLCCGTTCVKGPLCFPG